MSKQLLLKVLKVEHVLLGSNYSAKKLKLCGVFETLCGAFDRRSRVRLLLRQKWTDLDEICGTLEYIVWSWPWQILGAIHTEARVGARADLFCHVNNAQLYQFLVGQIFTKFAAALKKMKRHKAPMCPHGRTRCRHLLNSIEQAVYVGDATLCQIMSNYFDHILSLDMPT